MRTILAFILFTSPMLGHAEALKIHRDSLAGVKFQIPFASAKVYNAEKMTEMLTSARATPPPPGVTYTSGIYAKQGTPFIVVWTQHNDRAITREFAEHFATGGANAQLTKIGLQDFSFDRERLRGEGRLPDSGGLKIKILLLLLQDHITYIGFHYKKSDDLALFNKLKGTLTASKRQVLRFESLPHEKMGAGTWQKVELFLLCAASGLIGFFSVIFYRQMGGRLPGDASRISGTNQGSEPNCTPGRLNLETTPELS